MWRHPWLPAVALPIPDQPRDETAHVWLASSTVSAMNAPTPGVRVAEVLASVSDDRVRAGQLQPGALADWYPAVGVMNQRACHAPAVRGPPEPTQRFRRADPGQHRSSASRPLRLAPRRTPARLHDETN